MLSWFGRLISAFSDFKNHWINTLIRTTKQRTAILKALTEADDFMTAQQLHELLKADGESVGLATVYRNMQPLVDAGLVDVIVADNGEAIYRQCSTGDHHHHLVCRSCGKTVEFAAPELEKMAHSVADQNGYTGIQHTMEIFGYCPECTVKGLNTEAK